MRGRCRDCRRLAYGALDSARAIARTSLARVVVLEAARCGDGASARNGGFLHGYWAGLPRLVELFGRDDGGGVAREATGVYDAVEALGEDVWLTKSGVDGSTRLHTMAAAAAVDVAARWARPRKRCSSPATT